MMYELVSKKTGKQNLVDNETYQDLKERGELKKYNVTKLPEPDKIIPDEIIVKKKVTKTLNND